MLTFEDYTTLVLDLESLPTCDTWRKDVPLDLYRMDHALTGMVTELGELHECFNQNPIDKINLREELGDFWWYVAVACHVLKKLGLEVVFNKDYDDASENLTIYIGRAFDVVKRQKWYYSQPYGKACWTIIQDNVSKIISIMLYLSEIWEMSVEEIWEKNIQKLHTKRYPDGKFSIEKALNRDLDGEREVLT